MKRIIRYITWYFIDKRRLDEIMEKRKSGLIKPKPHSYTYSMKIDCPTGLEELRKLKKEIEELEKEWEQNPPHSELK
jgi:hypothetical protein